MRNLKYIIFSLSILFICYDESMAAVSPCGDWEPYKDEKCFKVLDKVGTEEEAEKICSQQEDSSTLITIHSKDEQDFLSSLLFKTHKVVDAVWIGAKYSSNKFKWSDDSDIIFSNWAEESPKNKTDSGCVQMIQEGSSIGKWVDEPCNKNNKVVCQKMQTWSLSRLQNILFDVRKEFKDYINVSDKKLNDLQQNPVPIGFIYVQLPSQPEPKTLWSMVEWKDVTSEYAGLFFRAEGGGSAAFEQIQNENSPRLTAVTDTLHNSNNADYVHNTRIVIAAGETSKKIHSGDQNTFPAHSLSFEVSGGEVRPRNKAMRIWKRTK